MNNIKSQLKMHYINSRKAFIIFWTIMFALSILGMSIAVYMRSKGYSARISSNNIFAVAVFGVITSVIAYNETLPYILNMSQTRKSFVISFSLYSLLLSFTLSVVFTIFILWENLAYTLLGFSSEGRQIYQGLAGSNVRETIGVTITCFFIVLVAISLFVLIGSIYYKKGMMFVFGLGALIIFVVFILGFGLDTLKYIVVDIFLEAKYFGMTLFSVSFFISCYIITFFLARTSQLKK